MDYRAFGGSARPMITALGACGLVLAVVSQLRAQDPMVAVRRCAEIHDAIAGAGIPIESVRLHDDGRYELILAQSSTPSQWVEAERIKASLIGERSVIVVDNVQDALVVLRYEPDNASANRVLRERYEALKRAARSGQ